MLLDLGTETQAIDVFQCIPERIATGKAVFDFTEDFTDFVFDGIRAGGALFEALQVGEEITVYIVDEVITGKRIVVVKLAIRRFWRGPGRPAVCVVDDVLVGFAVQFGVQRLFLLKIVQVLEKQHPGCLFGVVQFRGAARLFPEDVIDIFEGLLEHIDPFFIVVDRLPQRIPKSEGLAQGNQTGITHSRNLNGRS